MVVENLNNLGDVCSIIFLDARSDCRDLYASHHKIYSVKISHSSNFNPVSITLWYENNISQFLVILYWLTLLMILLIDLTVNGHALLYFICSNI